MFLGSDLFCDQEHWLSSEFCSFQKKKFNRPSLTNAAVSIKLLELSVTSLSGFCFYDGGPGTKKRKVVASNTERKGGGNQEKEKPG